MFSLGISSYLLLLNINKTWICLVDILKWHQLKFLTSYMHTIPFLFLHHLVAYLLFMRKNFCRVHHHHHARYTHSGTFLNTTLRVPILVLVVNKRHYWQEDKDLCCTSQNVKEYKVESAFEFYPWLLFSRIWHNHSNFNRFVFRLIFCIAKNKWLYKYLTFILICI